MVKPGRRERARGSERSETRETKKVVRCLEGGAFAPLLQGGRRPRVELNVNDHI
jgi:hypothetical protein